MGSLIGSLWLLWDAERQCLWDKVTLTHVAYSPRDFRPLTAQEMRFQGQQPPGRALPSTAAPSGSPPPPETTAGGTADRLRELRDLRDERLITDEEFERQQARIVDEL